MSSTGHLTIWLRSRDNAVMGGDTAFTGGVVLVKGDGRVALPHERGASGPSAGNIDVALPVELSRVLKEVADKIGVDNENHVLFMGAGAILLFFTFLRFLAYFRTLAILLPLFISLRLTIPDLESFDVKKELKRVLRKEQLPASHPDKPRGWLEKVITKGMASVTGELLSGAGYEQKWTTFAGCWHIQEVELYATKSTCKWIGVFNKWYFLGQSDNDNDD